MISQRGTSNSRFTFTAAESGQHVICFTASGAAVQNAGWLSGGSGTGPNGIGATKLTLDLAIGETSKIESEDKGKMADIVQKVRDLNGRLQDIRREQVFQRVYNPPLFSFVYSSMRSELISYFNRNAKPNFAINPKPPTRESCGGH